MKKIAILTLIGTGLFTQAALAEQPSFDYIEGGYTNMGNGDAEDFTGIKIRGSKAITDNVYVLGEVSDTSSEVNGVNDDVDLSIYSLGAGVNFGVSDTTAVYSELTYTQADVDFLDLSDSTDGFTLSAGVRSMVTDSTEVYGEISSIDMASTMTQVSVGAKQYITDNFGVFGEVARTDNEDNGYTVGVTYRF